MEANNSLVIETRGLSKIYIGVLALKSLDLRVPQHSISGFLGPNDAGILLTKNSLSWRARCGALLSGQSQLDNAGLTRRVELDPNGMLGRTGKKKVLIPGRACGRLEGRRGQLLSCWRSD